MKRGSTLWWVEANRTARAAFEWLRGRSRAWLFVKYGAGLIVLSIGGSALFSVELATEVLTFSYTHNPQAAPWDVLPLATYWLGLVLIALGVLFAVGEAWRDHRLDRRRLLLILEHRGLTGVNASPLLEAIPRRLRGHRDVKRYDQTAFSDEAGQVTAPEAALAKIEGIRRETESSIAGRAPEDVLIIYGGLAPVPFAVLAGALLRNFAKIEVFDWERHKGRWQRLDDSDDDSPIHISALPDDAEEAVLALSASYPYDRAAIEKNFPGLPVMEISVDDPTVGNHWSADWQVRMKETFLKALQDLAADGVRRIYLVAAVPNSLAFGLGQTYDPRLHPELLVCQYERSASPPYPWALRLPRHGAGQPEIVYREHPRNAGEAA